MPRNPEYYFRWNDSDSVKKLIIQQVMVVKDMEEWQQTRRDLGNDSNDEFINQKIAPLQKKREALQKRIDRERSGESSMRPKPVKISTPNKPLVTFKPAPAKKVVAKKVMKARSIPKDIPVPTKFKADLGTGPYFKADKLQKISDDLRKLLDRDRNNPEMKDVFEKNLDKFVENRQKIRDIFKMMKYVPEIKPKKVVAKKVKKAPAKKMVAKVMKPAMKKPMKKPIAYGNVETALTGKRPRKAPAKPTQVARFFVGGSVLPKGKKVPMPKKTTTTMKARKPMSAETKLKIKKGVQKYHKKCKEAMAMHSKMKK